MEGEEKARPRATVDRAATQIDPTRRLRLGLVCASLASLLTQHRPHFGRPVLARRWPRRPPLDD